MAEPPNARNFNTLRNETNADYRNEADRIGIVVEDQNEDQIPLTKVGSHNSKPPVSFLNAGIVKDRQKSLNDKGNESF